MEIEIGNLFQHRSFSETKKIMNKRLINKELQELKDYCKRKRKKEID
jgi:hypothetical protein